MTYLMALTKATKNTLTETDPNNFIFHSGYNTFKIILTGTTSFTVDTYGSVVEKTIAHGLSYIPLVHGFCRIGSVTKVFSPNQLLFDFFDEDFYFNSIVADSTNIIFRFTNNKYSSVTAYVRYYVFEIPL